MPPSRALAARRGRPAREHNPKTYRIEEVNGTLDFATYQTKPVREQSASEGGDGKVPSALYFNDVWQYDLDCHRWADYSCNSTQEQWVPLDPGAVNGGCRIVMGEEICTTPSERFLHGAGPRCARQIGRAHV